MATQDQPRKKFGKRIQEEKPFRFVLPGLGATISSFQPKALFYVRRICILNQPVEGAIPDGTIRILYEPHGVDKSGHMDDWWPTEQAAEVLKEMLGPPEDKGVRFASGDGKLALLINGQEIYAWPTTEAAKKADWQWLIPVANEYLEPEALAIMFPKSR